MPFDFRQIWEIASAPDNVPIVALLFLAPFYMWYALRQAVANDKLIAILESDAQAAKTKYRKTQEWDPKWEKEVHTWPYLMRMEFLVAILVTVLLMAWSLTLNAPLEEPANPERHHESGQGALVFPGPAGNAGLLRPLDRRRSDADADYRRA